MPSVLFACAISVLFFACAQLAARNKQPLHYCMATCCFAAGYIYLYGWTVASGLIVRFAALANSDIAALFVLAPAFYLASLSVLHEGRRPVRSYSVYFVAPVLAAIGSAIYNAIAAPLMMNRLGTVAGHFSTLATTLFTLCADLSFIVAIVLDLVCALRLHKAGQVRNKAGFRHQVVFLFCYLAGSFIVLSSWLVRDDKLYFVASTPLALVILAYALSRTSVSYFPQSRPIRPHRQGKPEWDGSAQELTARLIRLMDATAPYRDATLTLRRLATLLGEEPKRLSII